MHGRSEFVDASGEKKITAHDIEDKSEAKSQDEDTLSWMLTLRQF